MGTMRFRFFPPERISEEAAQQAYLSGIDRVSWPVRVGVEAGGLALHRSVSDSGRLHLPWPIAGRGLLTLSTGSLMEQAEPYCLPLEIARGTVVDVRNQLGDWQGIGLSVPEAVYANLSKATERLSWAAVERENLPVSAKFAEESICAALQAADLLAIAYSEQALAVRRRNGARQFLLLGGDLGPALLDDYISRQFLLTFNTAVAPLRWRETETSEGNFSWTISDKQIEWCRAHKLNVMAGPLLLFDRRALPDWLYLFEDDFDNLLDFVTAFLRAAVRRYRGKVDAWICAGRVAASEALAISEQERLRLVARAVELVRELDPDTPALVSFDQPWAEYLRQRHSDFPPLHFADALLRADLDLSGLMLEINVGCSPGGSLPRHPLEVSRLLDAWGKFGLPLWLSLSAPSAESEDPLAERTAPLPANWWSPAAQQSWVARVVPLALAKPMVRGVLWNQLCDSQPHDFPHGGLFDAHRQAKPALRTLAAIRQMGAR